MIGIRNLILWSPVPMSSIDLRLGLTKRLGWWWGWDSKGIRGIWSGKESKWYIV
jgi:hypothetical protein